MSKSEDEIVLFPGITGFRYASEVGPRRTEVAEFRRVVLEGATSKLGYRVSGFDVGVESSVRSYYQALLEDSRTGNAIQLLLNPFGNILATALDDQRIPGFLSYDIKFVETSPPLRSAFGDTWSVPPLRSLHRRLTPEDLARLNGTELYQVRYWGPETVGQVIFNYWD